MDREKEYVWTRLHFFQFDENNPKEHNYSEIENSIKRFGFIELPVVNKVTNTLVAGHGRIAALQNMAGRGESMPKYLKKEDDTQEWLIPTVVVEFETDAEAKAYIVASNQLTIDGSWNEALLLDLLQDINAATQNLLGTGFDLEDIMQMEEFQNAPLKFDEDFGKEVHYVKVEADSAEHAESIKAQLKELGFICQVKSITK